MFAKFVTAGVALLISSATAQALDPEGRYMVRGTYPGGGNYSGTAVVERTGNSYRVTWTIGGQTFVGTGVATDGTENAFAAYRPGNQPAILVYQPRTTHWQAVWTYNDSREVGVEHLLR